MQLLPRIILKHIPVKQHSRQRILPFSRMILSWLCSKKCKNYVDEIQVEYRSTSSLYNIPLVKGYSKDHVQVSTILCMRCVHVQDDYRHDVLCLLKITWALFIYCRLKWPWLLYIGGIADFGGHLTNWCSYVSTIMVKVSVTHPPPQMNLFCPNLKLLSLGSLYKSGNSSKDTCSNLW